MTIVLGLLVTLGCMLGGFVFMGGHIAVIWQPAEYVIICGAAIGTFIVANPVKVIKDSGKGIVEALEECRTEGSGISGSPRPPLCTDEGAEVQAKERGRSPHRKSGKFLDLHEVP